MPLTQRAIFGLYWPLALSWLFMAVEGPVAIAIISRLPEAQTNQAAFVAVMGLSIFIESPVIDLLATSTTLATCRARFLALRRFTLLTMGLVTAIHAIIAFTPAFDWVAYRVLALEPAVAETLRPAFAIMTPWSAFIGWRRFMQGIMIRRGQTGAIGFGTVLRMATIVVVGFGLYGLVPMSGATIVATALVASVGLECLFVHLLARRAVEYTLAQPDEGHRPMGLAQLGGFHVPLTASTVLMMSTNPMIVAALSRTSDPVALPASWAVAMSVLWLFRTVTYALPEAVIALYQGEPARRSPLLWFCVVTGLFASGALAALVSTPLDGWFMSQVLGAKPTTAVLAGVILVYTALLPISNAVMSFYRAMLTSHHLTSARLIAIFVAVATLAGTLALGLARGWPGALLPGIGLTLGHTAELAVLAWHWRRSQARLDAAPVPGL